MSGSFLDVVDDETEDDDSGLDLDFNSGDRTFKYHPITPVKFSHHGEKVDVSFFQLKAPTSKVSEMCSALKQGFFVGMRERSADPTADAATEAPSDYKITSHDVIVSFSMADKVKLSDMLGVGKKLFLSPGIVTIDGEVPLKQSHLDSMALEDLEAMVGHYLVNFTLASLLRKMQQKSRNASSD